MIETNQIDYNNIRIDKVTLINGSNRIELFNYKDTESPSSNIEQFVLVEDMFSSILTGKLVINDNSAIIEQLKLSGWESVLIDVTWKETVDLGFSSVVVETAKSYEMNITDISSPENQVEKKASGPAGNKTTAILSLTSKLFTIDNLGSVLQDEFMGKIAKGNAKYLDPEENKLDGYIDAVAKLLPSTGSIKKPWKIDGTDNDIWIKKEPNMYPWNKKGTGPRFLELMNYILEYACDYKNKNAVNFLFWEDLEYINFRSVESLLREQQKPKRTYVGTFNDADKYAIFNLFIISDFNALKLLYNGALFGEYFRVMPDWKNPYWYLMDTSDMFKREWVSWYYENRSLFQTIQNWVTGKKTADWLKIEQYDPITEDVIEYVKKIPSFNSNRMVDSLYGFYNDGSHNNKSTYWWEFWDPSQNGFTGEKTFFNNSNLSRKDMDKRTMFLQDPEILKPTRLSNKMWQAQYDMMDLPITKLKTILTEIKWPLSFNRFKYAEAKKTKLKWDEWKKKICCERRVPSTFFAILTDAQKIFGPTGATAGNPCVDSGDYFDNAGIWAYKWQEVELWPRSEVETLKGQSLMYFYFYDKDGVKNDPSLVYSEGSVENTNSKFPFVFVVPPAGLSGSITTGLIKDSRVSVPVSWTKDTRAYNIREVLNSNFYGKTSQETYATTMLGTAVSAFGKLSAATDKTLITNYPDNYGMLPVGKFLLAREHTQDISFNGPYIPFGKATSGETGDFYFHGAMVQMYAVPASTVTGMVLSGVTGNVTITDEVYDFKTNKITTNTLNTVERVKYFKNDYLFVFDAPNNHAGICRCQNI